MDQNILSYGTSGFRYNHKVLIRHAKAIGRAIGLLMIRRYLEKVKDESCLKCEVLPLPRQSKTVYLSGTWGVMVTASHNPAEDNGVKIVDSDGNMVTSREEKFLERCVQGETSISDVFSSHYELMELNLLTITLDSSNLRLAIGRDTRESGPIISELIIEGVRSILPDIQIKHMGFCTTPEFHIMANQLAHMPIYSELAHTLFARTFYVSWVRNTIRMYNLDLSTTMVDCANGVGFRTLRKIYNDLDSIAPLMINTGRVFNTDQLLPSKMLNFECGSDFVENNPDKFVSNLSTVFDLEEFGNRSNSNRLGCSFDGDADRIIFHYIDDDLNLKVMNGDHIISLILRYVVRTLQKSPHVKYHMEEKIDHMINIGVVYTPYANGGFIAETERLAIETYDDNQHLAIYRRVVPIGVKHLIAAAKSYDIAIYFEPNGHGSVLINKDFGIRELKDLRNIFNQIIGDGITNLLGVTYILRELDMTPKDMFELFAPMPNLMFKIPVDRAIKNMIKMENTRLVEPISLVNKISELESSFKNARIFIRPSGTEEILRAYIEGENTSDIEIMRREVEREIINSCPLD